ncbi:tyrosine-type recombinase/integrase [Rhodoblastus acidophilus]|uniref:Tyrosine-type recombinase/integrase n=1 Tax=Rhodoblastus acidophilus TaxID=1074 RepID=A0A6N8DMN9_RHOAC|nr:tyrosine-type recombinase/integrase [Rhodoblastus acidophilus]
MAKTLNRLNDRFIKTVSEPGRYADGGNLYLSVSPNGGRRWVFFFKLNGKQREAGLGSLRDVSLKEARGKADAMRKVLAEGRDPIDARKTCEAGPAIPTFGAFADELVDTIEEGFRNEKHRYQWKQTLGDAYCAAIRSKRVDEITVEDVLRILQPLWLPKQETASRLRGRLERVFDAAKAKGLRSSENPARWKGNLKELLPARRKLQRGHQPAMPYADVPAFIGRLRERQATSALALEFLILTAARVSEVLGATWDEIDLEGKLWTLPAERMKAGRQHRVPLVSRSIDILNHMKAVWDAEGQEARSGSALVFFGAKRDRPLSNMAFAQLLERMGERGFVPHGFRSSFRDWCGECTDCPREVAEAALAHVVGNTVEQAYRRGDALEKRRNLMASWAQFVDPD